MRPICTGKNSTVFNGNLFAVSRVQTQDTRDVQFFVWLIIKNTRLSVAAADRRIELPRGVTMGRAGSWCSWLNMNRLLFDSAVNQQPTGVRERLVSLKINRVQLKGKLQSIWKWENDKDRKGSKWIKGKTHKNAIILLTLK